MAKTNKRRRTDTCSGDISGGERKIRTASCREKKQLWALGGGGKSKLDRLWSRVWSLDFSSYYYFLVLLEKYKKVYNWFFLGCFSKSKRIDELSKINYTQLYILIFESTSDDIIFFYY